MGALHAGHAKLLETARHQNNFVVVSIFVNPLQFERPPDLEGYPRNLDEDVAVCARAGVDVVFAPYVADLYPGEQLTFVDVPALSEHLCGKFRAGHFRGVATVVLKLFNIVQPQRAYFGEKDAQQLAIIRRMVSDLNLPITIVPVPTVREEDGVALSSRNRLLTEHERAVAPRLYRMLKRAASVFDAGERSVAAMKHTVLPELEDYRAVRIEYFEVVDPETLAPVEIVTGPVLIAAAVWLGTTRLIDNVMYCP